MSALRSLTDDACSWCEAHGSCDPPNCPTRVPRPATRVGRHLLFPGGRVTRVSRWEQLLFAIGLKTSTTTGRRSL
jgi:hypothetical protein